MTGKDYIYNIYNNLLPLELKGLILCTSVTHLKPTTGPWHSSWHALIILQQLAVVVNARSQPQETAPMLIIDLCWKGTQRARNLFFLFTDKETEALGLTAKKKKKKYQF